MRDVWRWWKVRKPQLRALLVLGLIFLWMSLNLWQTQRNFHKVMRLYEQNLKQLEASKLLELDQLTEALETHQAQQDLDAAALRRDLWDLSAKIGQFVERPRPEVNRN